MPTTMSEHKLFAQVHVVLGHPRSKVKDRFCQCFIGGLGHMSE